MGRKRIHKDDAEKMRKHRAKKKRENSNALALRNNSTATAARPALLYHGSKFRLAKWIISHFPVHDTYVEPYGGGAAVLLRKAPAFHEIYNDLNSDVVNFFHVLREYPEKFIRAIQLTPYSREEHARAWDECDDPIEKARRFYVRIWQSHGSGTSPIPSMTGWKFSKTAQRAKSNPSPVTSWDNTNHLWDIASRLKSVHIEHDDALAVIDRFDTPRTLFYLDPPYVLDTRSENWAGKAYAYEMSDADHVKLAEKVKSIQGLAVISGYPSDLYSELYRGWQMVSRESMNTSSKSKIECLWLSPRASDMATLPMWANATEQGIGNE